MELLEDHCGQSIGALINVAQLIPLPSDTPMGNMALKFMRVVERLGHANRRIGESHEAWRAALGADPVVPSPMTEHMYSTEEAVYMIRRVADELIALDFYLHARLRDGQYPDKLEVDSVGAELNSKSPRFGDHRDFLRVLNEISNAHKHSFVQSDLVIVGSKDPCVVALPLSRNALTSQLKFYVVRLDDVVTDFNRFSRACTDLLRMSYAALQAAGGMTG